MVVESGGQHGQEGPTASRPTFYLIQVLRAAAALMVVAHHATIMLWDRLRLPTANWVNGASGVDLFFVISGFIMTVSSEPLLRAAHPAGTFLARRIERVVPMYWLVTTIKVIVLMLVPALGLNAMGAPGHVLASYLFFPSYNPQFAMEPVVVVGWTLNFEMAFYLLFAVGLAARRRALILPVFLFFGLWPVVGRFVGPAPLRFYESTLVLEFLFGVSLGMALPFLRQVPWAVGLGLLAAGFVPLLTWPDPNFSPLRGLWWGLPASAVVAGAVILERRWGQRSPRWALQLGDASYSIYLVHTFALPAVGMLLGTVPQAFPGVVAFSLALAMVLSTTAGDLAYLVLERPITNWFKGRRKTAIPAST